MTIHQLERAGLSGAIGRPGLIAGTNQRSGGVVTQIVHSPSFSILLLPINDLLADTGPPGSRKSAADFQGKSGYLLRSRHLMGVFNVPGSFLIICHKIRR